MAKTYIAAGLRARVATIARYRCGYCQTSQNVVGPLLEIDHIIAEALGGPSTEDNLWLACPLCNKHKGIQVDGADPKTDELVALFNPRTQVWSDHFEWIEEGTVVRGVTATGRATVEALRLNLESRVTVRRLWVSAGWHPLQD